MFLDTSSVCCVVQSAKFGGGRFALQFGPAESRLAHSFRLIDDLSYFDIGAIRIRVLCALLYRVMKNWLFK